jgi:ribonucleoside-diphosphate reductase alpha chain
MAAKFLSRDAQYQAGVNMTDDASGGAAAAPTGADPAAARTGSGAVLPAAPYAIQQQEDAPPCPSCGSIMIRAGACYKCANCGTTSGCA